MRLTLPLSAAIAASLFAFAVPAFATTGCNAAGWDDKFSDVRGCDSSYPAIRYLEDKGIVEGYQDGTYHPDDVITRAEFTKILMAVLSTKEERDQCMTLKWIIFRDVPHGEWFAPYICIAKQRGIVDGYPDGGFAPHGWINYAEAAKIAANAYGLPIDEANEWDHRWYAPYSHALLQKHAVPPTVESYDGALTRAEMAEMIYRLETRTTSMEWFASLPDGSIVDSYAITRLFPDMEFSYDGSSFSAKEGPLYLPDDFALGGIDYVHALYLSHVRPNEEQEGCNGMAGTHASCRPSLSKLEMAFGIVDKPMAHLALGMGWRDEEEERSLGLRPVRTFWEGVECEGRKYVFIPVDAHRTLAIMRTFNCNDASEGYLSGEEQDALFQTFLQSLIFHAEYVQQSAPTMDVKILTCKPATYDDPNYNEPVMKITRKAPKSSAVADMTLRALMGTGYTGDTTSCDGVNEIQPYYRGVTIENGVATVKFSQSFEAIRASFVDVEYADRAIISVQQSFTANLKQFPSVQSVRYVVQ